MERGDIYHVDLDRTKGREPQGKWFVMVVSKFAFNQRSPAWVCPIATAAAGQRLAAFTVALQGAGLQTTGVVLCSQIHALDLRARNGRNVERLPDYIVDLVLDCLRDMVEA